MVKVKVNKNEKKKDRVEEDLMSTLDSYDPRSAYQKTLEDGPVIERIGKFSPNIREGYTPNKREKRIRDKAAHKIYSKRVQLAKNLVDKSDHHSSRGMCIQSLVSCNLSPQTYRGWDVFVEKIMDIEGGEEYFINNIKYALEAFSYHQNKLRMALFWCFIIFVLSTSFISVIPMYTEGLIVSIISYVILTASLLSIGIILAPRVKRVNEAREEYFGSKNPVLKQFVRPHQL